MRSEMKFGGRGSKALLLSLSVFTNGVLIAPNSSAQDSSYTFPLGEECPFELEHVIITLNETKNVKVTVTGGETASFNDFYVLILPRPGEYRDPIRLYFFQNSIPESGEEWIFGPMTFQQKLDFRIISRILFDRTEYDPDRPGRVTDMGFQHWRISFEDWCDDDWDDLVVDITLEPPNPSIVIMTPADMSSFVTDDARTYRVLAEGYSWDIQGNDISDQIDWLVYPAENSGYCEPQYLMDSRVFPFTAVIQPRNDRGHDPLDYAIKATVNPYVIPLTDVNRIRQDVIDTVRQQYRDYILKLPIKSDFEVGLIEGVTIPETYRVSLYDIFYATQQAYREWAGDPNAFFRVSSGYRSPRKNRNLEPKPGKKTSLHQYHWAIDMDFGDEGEEGTEDDLDFLRRFLQGYLRDPFDEFYEEYEGHVHIEMFNYSEDFPGIER